MTYMCLGGGIPMLTFGQGLGKPFHHMLATSQSKSMVHCHDPSEFSVGNVLGRSERGRLKWETKFMVNMSTMSILFGFCTALQRRALPLPTAA